MILETHHVDDRAAHQAAIDAALNGAPLGASVAQGILDWLETR